MGDENSELKSKNNLLEILMNVQECISEVRLISEQRLIREITDEFLKLIRFENLKV